MTNPRCSDKLPVWSGRADPPGPACARCGKEGLVRINAGLGVRLEPPALAEALPLLPAPVAPSRCAAPSPHPARSCPELSPAPGGFGKGSASSLKKTRGGGGRAGENSWHRPSGETGFRGVPAALPGPPSRGGCTEGVQLPSQNRTVNKLR